MCVLTCMCVCVYCVYTPSCTLLHAPSRIGTDTVLSGHRVRQLFQAGLQAKTSGCENKQLRRVPAVTRTP